jgi:hypothetical protein
MPTNRTPIRRAPTRFSPEVIAMFRRMVELRGQCKCGSEQCAVCNELDVLDNELSDELITTPWGGGPTIIWPEHIFGDEMNLGEEWRRNEGRALFKALCKAAGVSLK